MKFCTTAEFGTLSQTFLNELAAGEEVVVTKNGRSVAISRINNFTILVTVWDRNEYVTAADTGTEWALHATVRPSTEKRAFALFSWSSTPIGC